MGKPLKPTKKEVLPQQKRMAKKLQKIKSCNTLKKLLDRAFDDRKSIRNLLFLRFFKEKSSRLSPF